MFKEKFKFKFLGIFVIVISRPEVEAISSSWLWVKRYAFAGIKKKTWYHILYGPRLAGIE